MTSIMYKFPKAYDLFLLIIHRKKLSESHIGQKSWSKGLTKNNHPGLLKISNSKLGKNNPMYGKKLSPESIRKGQETKLRNKLIKMENDIERLF